MENFIFCAVNDVIGLVNVNLNFTLDDDEPDDDFHTSVTLFKLIVWCKKYKTTQGM